MIGGQSRLMDHKCLFQQITGLSEFLLIIHIHTKVVEAVGTLGMGCANRARVNLHRLAEKSLYLGIPPLILHHTRKIVAVGGIGRTYVAKFGFC